MSGARIRQACIFTSAAPACLFAAFAAFLSASIAHFRPARTCTLLLIMRARFFPLCTHPERWGVGCLPNGSVVICDDENHRIRLIDGSTGDVSTLAGTGWPGHVDGRGRDAKFRNPVGVCVDSRGRVFVADWGTHCIRRIDGAVGPGLVLAGNVRVSTLAGTGVEGYIDGPGATARFKHPWGVGCNTDGTFLIVVDTGNFRIRRVDVATGEVSFLAGSHHTGYVDGVGKTARCGGCGWFLD
jgi:hypothetical protein